MKNTKRLKFVLENCKVENDCLAMLTRELKTNIKTVRKLRLEVQGCQQISDEGVMTFVTQPRKNLKNLQELSLTFDCCEKITGEFIESPEQSWKNLKKLTKLELNFDQCKRSTISQFQSSANLISQDCRMLKQFDVQFSKCDIITLESYANFIAEIAAHSKRTKQLSLEIDSWKRIMGHWTDSLLIEASLSSKAIKQLTFCFQSMQVTDDDLEILASQINHNFQAVEKINFMFAHRPKISDYENEKLWKHLEKSNRAPEFKPDTLSSAMFPFSPKLGTALSYAEEFENVNQPLSGPWDLPPYKKGMTALANQFSHFKNLKDLTLHFRAAFSVSNKGLVDLFVNIGNHLPDLQRLSLDIFNAKRVLPKTIEVLGQSIKSLKKLQDLSLLFVFGIKITDEGFSKLGGSVSNFKHLRKLDLTFSACQISSEGFKRLTVQITEDLRNLQELTLNFTMCDEISDFNIFFLGGKIGNLKKLRKLDLSFGGGGNVITDESVLVFATAICDNLKVLQELSLDFATVLPHGKDLKSIKTKIRRQMKAFYKSYVLKFDVRYATMQEIMMGNRLPLLKQLLSD